MKLKFEQNGLPVQFQQLADDLPPVAEARGRAESVDSIDALCAEADEAKENSLAPGEGDQDSDTESTQKSTKPRRKKKGDKQQLEKTFSSVNNYHTTTLQPLFNRFLDKLIMQPQFVIVAAL